MTRLLRESTTQSISWQYMDEPNEVPSPPSKSTHQGAFCLVKISWDLKGGIANAPVARLPAPGFRAQA